MIAVDDLLISTSAGLYCPAGDFFVDPWSPVRKAIITHAHADHASPGSQEYLTASDGRQVLQTRLGSDASIQSIGYGERLTLGMTTVSLHPAGHILGSAQVRIKRGGEVWVVTGDYKTAARCDVLAIRTAALPHVDHRVDIWLAYLSLAGIDEIFAQINAWWRAMPPMESPRSCMPIRWVRPSDS